MVYVGGPSLQSMVQFDAIEKRRSGTRRRVEAGECEVAELQSLSLTDDYPLKNVD